jgi:prevent-host-death family protein
MATKQKPPASVPRKPKQQHERGRSEGLRKSCPLTQIKAHLSELIHEVEAGAEVVITRHGKPVARLIPDRGTGPRPLGFARGTVTLNPGWDEPLTYEDLSASD